MKERLKDAWGLISATYVEYTSDNAARLAAAIAFYAVFSIAPLLIIITAIAGFFVGEKVAMAEASGYLQQFAGPEMREFVLELVDRWQDPASGVVATAVGLGTLFWGSYKLFMALQDTLNMIWGVRPRSDLNFLAKVRMRLLPFAMVLLIGLLLLASMLAEAVLRAFTQLFGELFPVPSILVTGANFLISFGLLTVLFAAVFKILPDARIQWRDVWVGAALTAFLFSLGKSFIGLYLGHTSTTSVFGAAGSLVALLFWVYFSAQIFFLGAEFTQVYARKIGEKIEPDEGAVKIGRRRPPESATRS